MSKATLSRNDVDNLLKSVGGDHADHTNKIGDKVRMKVHRGEIERNDIAVIADVMGGRYLITTPEVKGNWFSKDEFEPYDERLEKLSGETDSVATIERCESSGELFIALSDICGFSDAETGIDLENAHLIVEILSNHASTGHTTHCHDCQRHAEMVGELEELIKKWEWRECMPDHADDLREVLERHKAARTETD